MAKITPTPAEMAILSGDEDFESTIERFEKKKKTMLEFNSWIEEDFGEEVIETGFVLVKKEIKTTSRSGVTYPKLGHIRIKEPEKEKKIREMASDKGYITGGIYYLTPTDGQKKKIKNADIAIVELALTNEEEEMENLDLETEKLKKQQNVLRERNALAKLQGEDNSDVSKALLSEIEALKTKIESRGGQSDNFMKYMVQMTTEANTQRAHEKEIDENRKLEREKSYRDDLRLREKDLDAKIEQANTRLDQATIQNQALFTLLSNVVIDAHKNAVKGVGEMRKVLDDSFQRSLDTVGIIRDAELENMGHDPDDKGYREAITEGIKAFGNIMAPTQQQPVPQLDPDFVGSQPLPEPVIEDDDDDNIDLEHDQLASPPPDLPNNTIDTGDKKVLLPEEVVRHIIADPRGKLMVNMIVRQIMAGGPPMTIAERAIENLEPRIIEMLTKTPWPTIKSEFSKMLDNAQINIIQSPKAGEWWKDFVLELIKNQQDDDNNEA